MLIYVYYAFLWACPLLFVYCGWAGWRSKTLAPVLWGLGCWLPIAYELWVVETCGVDCIRIDIFIVWPVGLVLALIAYTVAKRRLADSVHAAE